jgi:hypothetical protein
VAEQQGKAPDRTGSECYYGERVRLPADKDSAQVILHGVINERSGRGWRLIGATEEPSGDVVLLVWDTSGLFSG